MSNQPVCPKCQSPKLRWVTVVRHVPLDVLQCDNCGVEIAEEDWMPPMLPLVQGRCINCGNAFDDYSTCRRCGLTREEDLMVHDELRQMISGEHNLFDAARLANRAGRRLLALKLATASAHVELDHAESARALRVWLLGAIGEAQAALDDAKAWVDAVDETSAVAWACYGQQLHAVGSHGPAADAYQKALKIDRTQHTVRAQRSMILLQLSREGQALDEACKVLEQTTDPSAVEVALRVAEELCETFEAQSRDDEVGRLLGRAERHVGKSALLLAHRARLAAAAGDVAAAKKDLRKARKLNPELEIYERVEKALKPSRSSWWRW